MARLARERRKADRPGEILEAAFEEFVLKGYAGTRLDDIARRAGVTKGTIYVYFPGKEPMFMAMVREYTQPLHARMHAFLDETNARAADLLSGALRLFYDMIANDRRAREMLRLLIAEAGRFPALLDEHYEVAIGPVIARLQKALCEAAERGEIRAAPILAFPDVLLGPALSLNITMLLFGERRPIDAQAHMQAAVDLLLNGLMPKNDEPRNA
jgi:AcrR family transcriptional regulator